MRSYLRDSMIKKFRNDSAGQGVTSTAPVPDTPYISFDVFNTLVRRCVHSQVAFLQAVERKGMADGLIGAEGFVSKRLQAEKRAIRLYGSEGLTMTQIYSELSCSLGADLSEQMRRLEEEAEVDLCFPIPEMVAYYMRCLSGARVLLISDMYLSKSVIERILHRCGVQGYAELYVSSECGANKESGMLFRRVAEIEGINLNSLTHIGDNYSSDFLIPKSCGAKSMFVSGGLISGKPIFSLLKKKMHLERKTVDFVDYVQELCFHGGVSGEVGRTVFGPFLLSFVLWLRKEAKELQLDKILFLSRDGYAMEKAYRLVYPSAPAQYIYGSRRSMIVPMLWEAPDFDSVVSALGFVGTVSIGEFVDRLGLDRMSVGNEVSSLGMTFKTVINLTEDGQSSSARLLFGMIQEKVVENSKKEFAIYKKYLSSFIQRDGRYGLVDVGWRGNMQRSLVRTLNACGLHAEIYGLYTGYYPAYNRKNECQMEGFLFNDESDQDTLDREQCYNNVYESLFFAPHGTVLKFEECDGTVAPVLGPCEYDSHSTAFFQSLLEGALSYIRIAVDRRLMDYHFFSSEFALEVIERFGMEPSVDEAEAFGDCITDYQGTPEYLAKAESLSYYIFHPFSFLRDIRKCWWKPGFLRRVFGARVNSGELFFQMKRCLHGSGFDDWGEYLASAETNHGE